MEGLLVPIKSISKAKNGFTNRNKSDARNTKIVNITTNSINTAGFTFTIVNASINVSNKTTPVPIFKTRNRLNHDNTKAVHSKKDPQTIKILTKRCAREPGQIKSLVMTQTKEPPAKIALNTLEKVAKLHQTPTKQVRMVKTNNISQLLMKKNPLLRTQNTCIHNKLQRKKKK